MKTVLKMAALGLSVAALAACGGNKGSQTKNNVDALQNAADQSPPAAAEVLRNEADALRDQNIQVPPGDPNSPVQQAMNKAGNVQAGQENPDAPRQAIPNQRPIPRVSPEPQR